MAEHNDLGKYGEQLASEYLVHKGFKIVRKNYRSGKGEIDIISINLKGKYTFFEVKTRKGGGEPEQAVNKKKIKLLLETIDQYKYENKIEDETFLDIIAILIYDNKAPEIEHFEDVWLY
jgi:putative endonuclease